MQWLVQDFLYIGQADGYDMKSNFVYELILTSLVSHGPQTQVFDIKPDFCTGNLLTYQASKTYRFENW